MGSIQPSKYAGPYPSTTGNFQSFTKTWHNTSYPSISPTNPALSAAGKTVFITGGGSGIGKATAISFARAGAKAIAIFGRRIANLEVAAKEIRAVNPNTTVAYESVDIGKSEAVRTAFGAAITKLGGDTKIDILISNAGSLKPLNELATYDETALRESLDDNLIGAFNVVQAAVPLLGANAKVLNISSGFAHMSPVPGLWVYFSLKAAVVMMFNFLQTERPDLAVFNIHPGVVTTELNDIVPGQDDVTLPGDFNVWLASPEAAFLKGRFVWSNWDVEELKSHAKEIEESMLLKITLNGVPM